MYQCRVYDKTGQELAPALSSDAIIWVEEGTAYVMQYYDEDTVLRTVKKAYPVPLTIVLNKVVKKQKKRKRKASLTNMNLFLRDSFTCQYCGRPEHKLDRRPGGNSKPREHLTREHIVPRDQGGEDAWENVTTACNNCNGYKANRTPQEAGMKLRSKPYAPSQDEMDDKIRKLKNSKNK